MIKKEILLHFSSFFILFLFISLIKGWYDNPIFLIFWLGGVVGTLLPDIDHLLFPLLLRPQEQSSQLLRSLLLNKKYSQASTLLYNTRYEKSAPIFHNVVFQLFFLVFAFFISSSTSNLFGKGLVMAFSYHLLVDQIYDFNSQGNISRWFYHFASKPAPNQSAIYLVTNAIIILALSFFL